MILFLDKVGGYDLKESRYDIVREEIDKRGKVFLQIDTENKGIQGFL